ncbi:40s ribosomal protein s5-1 [Hordeum vulgare]|nr:40s ribosomal protein s5-1 [Hordeum vulgare]
MSPSSSSKEKFYEKVINPYLSEVMKHPQAIEMREGVLHIRDVQGQKKEGSEKARLAAVEHEVFKCQGMMEHGLNGNHSLITDFIREIRETSRRLRRRSLSYTLSFKTFRLKSMIYKTKSLV